VLQQKAMCNSMHIVGQQRWLTEPLCRATSRDQQGFEGMAHDKNFDGRV